MPVHTLNDYKGKAKEDAKRQGQGEQTYAGGTSSGLAVQNPGQPNQPAGGWRQRVMDTARDQADKGHDSDSDESPAPRGGRGAPQRPNFDGAGRRLGLTPSDPATQAGTAAPAPAGAAAGAPPAGGTQVIRMRIHLWQEGFSIEDGPLRRFDDPANHEFLDDLNGGRIPRELERQVVEEAQKAGAAKPKLHVELEPHNDTYKPPAKVFKAFAGSGKSLANEAEGGASAGGSSSGSGSVPLAAFGGNLAPAGSAPKLTIDEAKETTAVQIRLADGTRLQARFNLDHTVGDIRAFINNARPGHREFDIITPMPRQVFSDDNQTIAQAGLKGAAIVQHLK